MEVWEETLGQLPTAEEAGELLGSPERLADLQDAGALITLRRRSGEPCYPSRQFSGGEPLPGLAAAHRLMSEVVSPWTAASFALGDRAHPELGGQSVRDFAASGKPLDRLLLVTRRDAAALAH